MTPKSQDSDHHQPSGPTDADLAALDTLAALRDLPLLDYEDFAEQLKANPDKYRVDTLPLLPDDGIGVGEATLYRIPANLYGDLATQHRTTWAASVVYDYDGPDDWDLTITNSEADARESHAKRIASRLADGCPDPNEELAD